MISTDFPTQPHWELPNRFKVTGKVNITGALIVEGTPYTRAYNTQTSICNMLKNTHDVYIVVHIWIYIYICMCIFVYAHIADIKLYCHTYIYYVYIYTCIPNILFIPILCVYI